MNCCKCYTVIKSWVWRGQPSDVQVISASSSVQSEAWIVLKFIVKGFFFVAHPQSRDELRLLPQTLLVPIHFCQFVIDEALQSHAVTLVSWHKYFPLMWHRVLIIRLSWSQKRDKIIFIDETKSKIMVNSTRKSFRTSWINEDKTHPFSPRIRVWERPLAVEITSCWCVWLCRLSEHIDAVNPLQRQGFVWLDDLLWCWMPYLGNTLGQVHWSAHWNVIPGTK